MRDPDKQGIARAWRFRGESDKPDHEASLAQWVVNGPFHPLWSWWVVGLISLRDIPGVPPAQKQYVGAEYEIMVLSLDPKCYPPDPDAIESLKFLMPPDLLHQFDGVDDSAASEILDLFVQAIVDGRISPDSDHRMRNTSILETSIEHYKAGIHTPGDAAPSYDPSDPRPSE